MGADRHDGDGRIDGVESVHERPEWWQGRFDGREVARMEIYKQFEGVVDDVEEDGFTASLVELTDPVGEPSDASFSFKDIHPSEREFVVKGVAFTWTVGYETTADSHRMVSEIKLQRLPSWTEIDIRTIEDEGRKIFAWFRGGPSHE